MSKEACGFSGNCLAGSPCSWRASISSFVNCWDMLIRATTTPGISVPSALWSMRAKVTVNS